MDILKGNLHWIKYLKINPFSWEGGGSWFKCTQNLPEEFLHGEMQNNFIQVVSAATVETKRLIPSVSLFYRPFF